MANPGITYDANGNTHYTHYGPIGYDAENRITSEGSTSLYYDPSGKRVAEVQPNANTWTLYFYDITGQRIMSLPYPSGQQTYSLYFGGKLVVSDGVAVVTDRLGSVRANGNGETFSYLPYGEERTATADGRVKFGTYFRDGSGVAAQDYADQRYYNPWFGRFNTADPLGAKAANPANPSSWNMYSYVRGDPVNLRDPSGTVLEHETYPGPDSGTTGGDEDGGDGGGSCDPSDASCGNPCGNSLLPNPACPNPGPGPGPGPDPDPDPDPQPPPPPPPIWCEPDVIAAMKTAWTQSANGTSGAEAGFRVDGLPLPGMYTIVPNNYTNQRGQQTMQVVPGSTSDIFHVHPNGSDPKLSPADQNIANRYNLTIFSFSSSGLYEYIGVPGARNATQTKGTLLRSGLSWSQPCN